MAGVVFHRHVYCDSEEEFQELIDKFTKPNKEHTAKIKKNFAKVGN